MADDRDQPRHGGRRRGPDFGSPSGPVEGGHGFGGHRGQGRGFGRRMGWEGDEFAPVRSGQDYPERGFRHRRGPSRRPFEQGDLKWLTLDLIAAQPRHGYDIIKAIEEALDGHYSPSPGVVYPTLTLLEETGLIASETQGAKKLYSLTEAGRAELDANAATLAAVRTRLGEARAAFGGVPAPEVLRAMGNMRAALQVRLSKGPLSAEAISTITAALDRAASEIERS